MDFTNLREHYYELLEYLRKEAYSESHIKLIDQNIHWILRNEKNSYWQSYPDVYYDRIKKSESDSYIKSVRIAINAIQRFDIHGEYPNRRATSGLIRRGAYHQLAPEFKEAVDYYCASAKASGIKESSIYTNASSAAVFLYAMQKRGSWSLDSIKEGDVISFFLDDGGNVSKCGSYKRALASVFEIVANLKEADCKSLLAYLPQIRTRRKNIQYLTPEEAESVRDVLDDENSELSLRDRAVGKLLFFTGMRACDIAGMTLDAIDWETEEIRFAQQKTDEPLSLPLMATIGNSIHDYLAEERPESCDPHLFLGEDCPRPFKSGAVWHQAKKIYNEADIRQKDGDRRGTHIFRHNVATSLLVNGVSRPIISQMLGQTKPSSLNQYLHADFVHLKKCALSIEEFPVSEEVFRP